MHRLSSLRALPAIFAAALFVTGGSARAQRHSLGSSPPTAPPPVVAHPVTQPALATTGPIAPVSSGMGAIQFASASLSVPAPQTLARQLAAEEERIRSGALSSLGAPNQYLTRGHVGTPHAVQMDLLPLGTGDELDAMVTVELDGHIVSAVLVPDGEGWRRIATLTFASSFSDATTTASSFARPLRSWVQPGRYRAVYHASVNGAGGDFTENEADLRIINGRAVVVISYVSGARQCDVTGQLRPPHQTCELIQRWLEPDPTDPTHHFTLITGIGHISAREADDPLSNSRNYRLTRLRSFACQPFIYSDNATHFEPTANSAPCANHEAPPPPAPHVDHP